MSGSAPVAMRYDLARTGRSSTSSADGLANAALFNGTGVILFMLCLLLASPLIDFGYSTLVLAPAHPGLEARLHLPLHPAG